jgi:amino-acid N-acetyltransferase
LERKLPSRKMGRMDEPGLREQVDLIREVFSYQSRFDGKTIVLKIDYPVIESDAFPSLVKDLAVLRQTGIQIAVVPGAKERIDEVVSRYGVDTPFESGMRIVTSEAIPFVKMAAFDAANRVMTMFSAHKITTVTGNFVRARAIGVIGGRDFQESGKVDRIDAEPVMALMGDGMIPVFPCIGWSAAGKPYNLSSDELAIEVALRLQAVKLFFVTPGPGFNARRFKVEKEMDLASDGRVVRLNMDQARRFAEINAASPDPDVRKVEYAALACRGGVERVHIVDGTIEGVILKEIFSSLGIGTMVYAAQADSFRPLKSRDVPEVLRLMAPLVQKGILKPRTQEEIRESKDDYAVWDSDGMVQACGALHPYPSERCAEIAAIAVNPAFSQLGLGRRLITHLIERAKVMGLSRVFVLTTQTQDWFEALGFREGGLGDLPAEKRASYDMKRKSQVFILDIEDGGNS